MDGGCARPALCARNGAPGPAFQSRTSSPPRCEPIAILPTKSWSRADRRRSVGAITRSATIFGRCRATASIGPSCAVADVTDDSATIWTASQGTHGNRKTFARFLGLPEEAVRLIYVEGAGCYGMNGHEDAAADAAILSRAVGRAVRVQWSRKDEHGWDPKGSAAAPRYFRRGRPEWAHPRFAHRNVAAGDDAGFRILHS